MRSVGQVRVQDIRSFTSFFYEVLQMCYCIYFLSTEAWLIKQSIMVLAVIILTMTALLKCQCI